MRSLVGETCNYSKNQNGNSVGKVTILPHPIETLSRKVKSTMIASIMIVWRNKINQNWNINIAY
jgi:hypothetical protein